MAVTARRLRRLEAWSTWRAAGGTRQVVVNEAITVRGSSSLGDERIVVSLPLDSVAVASLGAGKVLRLEQDDATYDEYKIISRTTDDEQGTFLVTAAPLKQSDLQSAGFIFRKDSDGVVVYDFEILDLTTTEHITNWIIPALVAAGYSWITLGTITPTARIQMTYSWDTPLSSLIRLAEATGSELDIRRNGNIGYFIDIVTKVNSGAQRADLRTDKNLVNVTRVESSVEQATRVAPRGMAQDELHATMARAQWAIVSTAGPDVVLSDPAGGKGPIQFDNQLVGAYFRAAKEETTLRQVLSSVAATQTVHLASSPILPGVGDLVEFRADSAGADLTYLDNPAAVAAYGIKTAIREVEDVPVTNNLIKNPVMRVWPGTLPTNWTAVGAPTIAKQTAAPFTALGGASIKVTAISDGQGVVSDAVPIFPTAANPYVSGYAKVWVASGNVRVELLFTTPSGTKIFPALPDVASAPVLGQWVDLGESGYDAFAAGATAVVVRVVQHSAANSVFYVDAAQVTVTGTQQPFFEGSGGTRLWQEANEALRVNSLPVASYTVPLADLEAYDPVTWSESALVIGADARVVDTRLGIDIVTRIVGIERDYIDPQASSVTLSNKPQDLTDIIADTSRPERAPGASDEPLTNPQQPKLTASFDINGQLIINSFGDNDVTSQRIAWATGAAPSAATVRAASPIAQQNISGLATGSTYAQGTTVFIAAYAYNARGFESSPLAVISESRQGAIIDYTPFASNLTPVKIVSVLPGTGAFVGEIVFLTTDKKLYRWTGSAWTNAVDTVDLTGQIQTSQIAALAVTSAQIGANAVIAGKIAADAVGSAEIAALAVGTAELAALSVTTAKIAALAVTNSELAALAVTGAKIAANTITAANIQALTITAAEIAANAITATKILAGAVTTEKLTVGSMADSAILNGGFEEASAADATLPARWRRNVIWGVGSSVLTTADRVSGTQSVDLNAGSGAGADLFADTVPLVPGETWYASCWVKGHGAGVSGFFFRLRGGPSFNATTVEVTASVENVDVATSWTKYEIVCLIPAGMNWGAPMLLNYSTNTGKGIYVDDVTFQKIVVSASIQDGAIITNKLAANAVTAAKIAAHTITANEITALTITAAEIAAGTITGAKIAANTITAGNITALTITAAEIAALTITGAKIAAGTITADKLVANSITAGQIQAGAIGTTELAAGAVTATKIAAGSITANELAVGTITADRIVTNSITSSQTSPRARAKLSLTAAQAIPNNGGFISWGIADVDVGANGNSATGFTIQSGETDGTWDFVGQVVFAANATGWRGASITHNGVIVADVRIPCASATFQFTIQISYKAMSVAVGDVIRLSAFQTTGGNLNVIQGAGFTWFQAIHLW
jgi:hypothetical protein